MDASSTVTVLTSDFLNDIGSSRVLDATKYVAGISEATIPNGLDAINIRGFLVYSRMVDGFSTYSQANYDHGAIERVEVVKGPDALLHPTGAPGGSVNLVTKRPQWTPGGSIKVAVGEYDVNRFEADVTGPLSDKFAYRMVAAIQDNKGYIDGMYRESTLLTPSLTWRINPEANLTLRYEYYDFNTANVVGIPTDPSVGPDTPFRVLQGVPRTFNPTAGKKHEFRRNTSHSATALFTSPVTDQLSVRFAARVLEHQIPNDDLRIRVPNPGGAINPLTGKWEVGVEFDDTAPYAPKPAAPTGTVFGLTGGHGANPTRLRDVQNDWSYIVDTPVVKSSTMVGFAYSYFHDNILWSTRAAPDIDVSKETRPSAPPVNAPTSMDLTMKTNRSQFYLTEQLEFFEKRLILSGGVAHLSFNGSYVDRMSPADPPDTVAGQPYPASGSKATYNYGIVVKPLPSLSVYYGHTQNAVPLDAWGIPSVARGEAPTFSVGEQDEFGVKASFLDGRIIASVAYYEIEQTGFAVFNPGNFANPPPPKYLPPLYVTRKGSGWEYQFTGSLTDSLSLIASYADMKNRNPDGQMFKSNAEEMGSVYVRYEFNKGPVQGLAVALGVNYLGKRSVEDVSGYTSASTPDNLIPIQPSAYMPSHTLADVTVSYSRERWSYGVTVANVFDKDYYAAADSRYLIYVGNPRNVWGQVSYKF